MIDLTSYFVFVAAALVLLLTPGPAVLYIVARSVDQGRMAGIVSALGVGLGSMVHVMAAALGLSALLVSSALAFNLVKFLGAAYLIYLGLQKLREKVTVREVTIDSTVPLGVIFRQGVVVNILNPKTALFFFAFLPQFVDPVRGSVAVQILILGCTFVTLGIFSDSGYALLAGTLGKLLKQSETFARAQNTLTGMIYIGLGVVTAFSGSGSRSK